MQIFLIIVIICFAFVIGNHILDMKAPEEKVEAKLVNKKIESIIDSNNVMHENYLLYFEYHNQVKHFSVRYSVYNKYKKNTKGYLIHKRNKFVDFIIDEVY